MPTAKTFVPPTGNPQTATLVMVGEQPGQKEVRFRRPFIGPSGRELIDILSSVGLVRSQCYFTNVIKDLDNPLHHYISLDRKTPLASKSYLEYIQLLKKELEKTTGQIVAVGGVALYALTGRTGITKWRGSVVESTLLPGRYVVPTLHPATIIPPKNVYTNKLLIKFDLDRAKRIFLDGWNPIRRTCKIQPTFNEAMRFLNEVLIRGLEGLTIDYDIEIHNEELSCISFAFNPIYAMSIPFVYWDGDYFTPIQETDIMRMIGKILEYPIIRKRGQNVSFDAHFLLRKYGIKTVNLDDTMIAQHMIMPDYPKGLDFIASIHTDIPYYKDEGKKFLKGAGGRWDRLWNYNDLDSIVCNDAFPKQYEDIIKLGNEGTYENQRKVLEPLVYMQEHGIRVDLDGIKKEYESLWSQIEAVQEELNKVVGYALNPNSPLQVRNYFYVEKGIKPYKFKKKVTVNELALKRISRKGFKAAELILKLRHLVKIRSTYCAPDKFDSDSRVRCSYNPAGTRYSRLSSSENIFGTGMNLQNVPYYILQYFLADEGYIYYSFDESQIENRIVAYVGNIIPMIEAFESGKDVHRLTAALIFNKHPDEISAIEGSCPLGGGKQSERFWGKKANHGLNYDLGYKTFALYYELLESEAKLIVGRYHAAYPAVRGNYHKYVRDCLAHNRCLTNLLGRTTKFLDQWGDSLFKEAYSCIPQGTSGDLINERGVNYIYYHQGSRFRFVELLNQVHDSAGFQIPLSLPLIDHAIILSNIKKNLEQPLRFKDREFIVPADLTMGFNLNKADGKEIKSKDFPSNVEDLAHLLEVNINELKHGKDLH